MAVEELKTFLLQIGAVLVVFGIYLLLVPVIIGGGKAAEVIGPNTWYLESTIPGLVVLIAGLLALKKGKE